MKGRKEVVFRGRNTVIKLYFSEDGVLEAVYRMDTVNRTPLGAVTVWCDTEMELADACFSWFLVTAEKLLDEEEEVEVVGL